MNVVSLISKGDVILQGVHCQGKSQGKMIFFKVREF